MGKTSIKFYKPAEKINSDTYYNILKWLKANYPVINYVSTGEGASAQKAKIIEFLQIQFCHHTFSLSSSPDLKPLN